MPLLERIAFHGGSIQRVGAVDKPRAECIVKHPFPGIELEGELDRAVVEIDEFAVVAQPDLLDIDQRGFEAGLARGILQIGECAGILATFGHAGEMEVIRAAEFFPGIDQAFMD